MKKILGISAVVLLLGASAFAGSPSDPPFINYFLQLGGNDNAAQWKNTGTPAVFVPGSEADGFNPAGATVITWSVRVEAGGSQLANNLPMYVGGVANAVWDLVLTGPDGIVVGQTGSQDAAFGLGNASTTPGFFSAINDGTQGPGETAADPLEAGAFTWVFGNPPARIFDPVASNGPHLSRSQYPSLLGYPNNVPGQRPGVSTALSGTLVGMGAGYEQYTSAGERGGVGIPGTDPTYACSTNNLPIAEGQLNLTGLKGGTYTLTLTPGKGNNVVWNAINDCSLLDGGAFAIGVSNTQGQPCSLCGDTITFVLPVTGCTQPPAVTSVASVKTQGAAGDFGIPFINPATGTPFSITNAGGATNTSVECRANGVTRVDVTFDVAVQATDANPVAVSGGALTNAVINGNVLTVTMTTANQNGSCVQVTVHGIACANNASQIMADTTYPIRVLRGDVTGNGAVDIGDINAVRAASGAVMTSTATMFRRDVTSNGAIDIGDINNVRALSGNVAPTCP